jgi:mRNA interferase HigB
MASGIARSLDDAFRGATTNLVRWLEKKYGLNAAEVSSVLGTSGAGALAHTLAGLSRSHLEKHPETLRTLALWCKTVKRAQWRNLNEVRKDYPSADQVGDVLIFNVLGGNYRLIGRVTYAGQRIYVRALMTHCEYDRKESMKWA